MPRNKTKILHLYKSYLPENDGGIAQVIRNITTHLKNSFDFLVLSVKDKFLGDEYDYQGIKVVRSGSLFEVASLPISVSYLIKLCKIIRRYDIVHHHHPFPLADVVLSIAISNDAKLVVHWHSDIVRQKLLSLFVMPLIHSTLKRADKIIVTSQTVIEQSSVLKHYADKCVQIPFGFDIKYWSVVSKKDRACMAGINKKYGKFILAVGRLVSYKGFEYLIEAMKYVDKDVNLVIVGCGPRLPILKHLVLRHDLKGRVFIETKIESQDMLKNFYHACLFFVLPSISQNEAFGVVQVEAMACKKAIINTDLPSSVPLVARDNKEAITVRPKDVLELASAIKKLIKNDTLRAKFAKNSYKRALECFDINVFGRKMKELYKSLK